MATRGKWNWPKLKREYLTGDWLTVKKFLESKKIPTTNFNQTAGWASEKKALQERMTDEAKNKMVSQSVDEVTAVRQRQARLARYLQAKAAKKLKTLEIETIDEARRMVIAGMKEERKALGMGERAPHGGGLTQINIELPNTNLDKLLKDSDYEGVLKLLAEVKRERASRAGEATANKGTAEVQEGEVV